MNSLSPRQQAIMEFMRSFIKAHGYPPTIREIQRGCDISSSSVADYNLERLVEYGYIERDADVSRGIRLLERAND